MYYSDMRKMLQDNIPGFSDYYKPTQLGMAKAISGLKRDNRRYEADAFCIPHAYVKQSGHTSESVLKALEDLGLVVFGEEYEWSDNGTGKARDCFSTDLLKSLPFSDYNSPTMEYREITRRNNKSVCRDKDPDLTPREKDGVIIHHPYVDMDALQHFISVGHKHTRCPELWKMQGRIIQHFVSSPNIPYGMLPQDYRVNDKTHRIDGEGLNIQNQCKLLRSALLNQSIDYDIDCAHFAIIDNLYPTVYIKHYVANKEQMRHEIALDTQNTYDGVKQAMLAMLYGANPNRSLTLYLSNAPAFWNHPYVEAIRKEARPITQMERNNGPIYLMQEEQAIVKSITRTRDNVILPMHDGWIEKNTHQKNTEEKSTEEKNTQQEKNLQEKSTVKKELEEMAAVAKKYTGYNITITREVINYGFPSQQ